MGCSSFWTSDMHSISYYLEKKNSYQKRSGIDLSCLLCSLWHSYLVSHMHHSLGERAILVWLLSVI